MTTALPADFPYKDIYLRCRPKHSRFDDFDMRHPSMDTGKRAKIFAPFDALAGFYEMILSKEVAYVPKRIPDEDRADDLDRKLNLLSRLIRNTNDARERQIRLYVTYYVPCDDILSDAYGTLGQYVIKSGICMGVSFPLRRLRLDTGDIDFDDIYAITINNV